MADWQPIETAPKTGAYILLGNDAGTWIGKFQEQYRSGYRPPDPWQSMMLNHRHMGRFPSIKPTHWMPLPEPPKHREHLKDGN